MCILSFYLLMLYTGCYREVRLDKAGGGPRQTAPVIGFGQASQLPGESANNSAWKNNNSVSASPT